MKNKKSNDFIKEYNLIEIFENNNTCINITNVILQII